MRKSHRILIVAIYLNPFLYLTSAAQSVQTIDVGRGLNNKKTVYLQDIAQEVEYVRLETTEKCLIGGAGRRISADADNIIVVDKTFYRFSGEGKFLNSISAKGKGPTEFIEIAGFELAPDGRSFYIFDRLGKVLEFNLNGHIICEYSVSSGLNVTHLDKDLVVNLFPSRMTILTNGYRVVIRDHQGNMISQLLKIDQKTMNSINNLTIQNTGCYQYRDSTTVWEGLCDTIYRISKDFRVTPKFYLDLGKEKLPRVLKVTPNSPNYRSEIDKYIMPIKLLETDLTLYLETSDKGQPRFHLYNKDKGVCTTLPPESQIVNDFDGGPDFWPMGITSDGKMYMLCDITVLKDYWKQNTEHALKHPEKQKEFIQMLEKCNVNDNPIIMLVTPKKK
jgi:hypothetical protein